MITAPIAKLKAGLSGFLEHVKAGEEVLVTDHGRPVARIVPISGAESMSERMIRMAKEGKIRLPTARFSKEFFDTDGSPDPEGLVLKALLEAREEGW